MIGTIDVKLNAAAPQLPLTPLVAFVSSPSNLRIINVPRAIGKWAISRVYVVCETPDNQTQTVDCTLTGGCYHCTLAASASAGICLLGFAVKADGVKEDGTTAVTGYTLGRGDVRILSADASVTSLGVSYTLHLLDSVPSSPNKGDTCLRNGTWQFYTGSAWVSLSGGSSLTAGVGIDITDGVIKTDAVPKSALAAGVQSSLDAADAALPKSGGTMTGRLTGPEENQYLGELSEGGIRVGGYDMDGKFNGTNVSTPAASGLIYFTPITLDSEGNASLLTVDGSEVLTNNLCASKIKSGETNIGTAIAKQATNSAVSSLSSLFSSANTSLKSLIRTSCRPVIKDYAALKAYIDSWNSVTGMTNDEKIAAMKDEVVGLEIADYWANTGSTCYEDPMIITDVRMWKGEDYDATTDNKHLGVMLMRKYASAESVVFDRVNTQVATETSAQADTYYYGWAEEWDEEKTYGSGAIVNSGTGNYIYSSVIANNVGHEPSGATDAYWKLLSTSPSSYSSYNPNGLTLLSVGEGNALPTTYVRIFKNSKRDTTRNIVCYGDNNWKQSAYRQWLNSTVAKGTSWWAQQHVGQITPTNATTIRGYLHGISGFDKADGQSGAHTTEGLWKYVKRVYIKTWPNYVTDDTNDVSTAYETLDWMWLPSGDEYYGGVNRSGTTSIEGELSPYWKEATGWDSPSTNRSPTRIVYSESNKSSAQCVWLRSASRDSSCRVLVVYVSGGLNISYNAYYEYASTPACVIY